MTIYCEDPHDNWYAGTLADCVQAGRDHAGRAQFWLGALAGLTVFWSIVGWAVFSVL
jgi:hypothetical protein